MSTAQNLANKLGNNRKVIAWEGEVKVYENGRIEGAGACKEYRAGQAAQNTTPPVGKVGAEALGAFVRLGGFDGFLNKNGLRALKKKIKDIDPTVRNRFIEDFGSNISALNRFNNELHLFDAWRALDNKPILRVELDFLETFSDFQTGKATLSYAAHGCTHLDEAFIRHYTGPAYSPLNAATEGYRPTSSFLNEFRQGLEAALSKLPNDPIPVVHRGLGRIESDIARTWQQGQTITANKFWSTSKSKDIGVKFRNRGNGDVMIVLYHKTGKYVESITKFPNQQECLISIGKQYRVDLIENSAGIRTITLTEL